MNVPLGDTNSVKWVDGGQTHELDHLILNGVTIWSRIVELTGTATYSPITKTVTYQISGEIYDLTKWSYQAIRQEDSYDAGEVFSDIVSGPPEVNGTIVESPLLGVGEDGTWDVTFRGYDGDTLRGTATATVTVATPFIEITSVQELNTSPPPLAVGTMVGVVVSIDHQDRNDDEDSECITKAAFFENFDSLTTGLPGGSKTTGTLPYLNHPTAYWYFNPAHYQYMVWNGVGEVGDCIGDNNANLEHTATMDGVTYKIRYRQILNSSVPSGLSLDVSDSQVNQVTSSTSDQYHSFLSASYMQAFWKTAGDSRNHSYIEAYIYSVS